MPRLSQLFSWSAKRKMKRPVRTARRSPLEILEPRLALTGSTQLLADVNPTGFSDPTEFVQVGDWLYFAADDGEHGFELWRTDGTTAGTTMVKDIFPGSDGSYPLELTELNSRLMFTAADRLGNVELWTSDGTAEGTVMVRDINPEEYSGSDPRYLVTMNGTLFFAAAEDEHGVELWRSDGTEAGTTMVRDIDPTPGYSSLPELLTPGESLLYFLASDASDYGLWRTDGTEAGTMKVTNVERTSFPWEDRNDFATVGDRLFFAAVDDQGLNQLWVTDGTEETTTLLPIALPGSYDHVDPQDFAVLHGTLYFSAHREDVGRELWKSNGTSAGTMLVKDIVEDPADGSYPHQLTVVGEQIFLVAWNEELGEELWQTDGTTEGTMLVRDIIEDFGYGSYPDKLTEAGGQLYFVARTLEHGRELWTSDGTLQGTRLVHDVVPGPDGSYPRSIAEFQGKVIFAAENEEVGIEPWIHDPDSIPTLEPHFEFDFTAIASDLHPTLRFFGSPNPDHAPFEIIRYGRMEVTSLRGFPVIESLIGHPSEIVVEFGSADPDNPVSVVTLQEFDNGLSDGLANQIYRPEVDDIPLVRISVDGVPVAVGVLQELALQTTVDAVVTSPGSRFQLIAPAGADTRVYDELMLVTGGTGVIPFALNEFALQGPWAGVGDAEIFDSTGAGDLGNVKQLVVDFSGDEQIDGEDIDELSRAIHQNLFDRRFDLNRDGEIDTEDIATWLAWAGEVNSASGTGYLPADLNLDGAVDASDLNIWSANAFTQTQDWSSGDVNTDGYVDGRDFNIWLSHRFQVSPIAAAATTRAPRAAGSSQAIATPADGPRETSAPAAVCTSDLRSQDTELNEPQSDETKSAAQSTSVVNEHPASGWIPLPLRAAQARRAAMSVIAKTDGPRAGDDRLPPWSSDWLQRVDVALASRE